MTDHDSPDVEPEGDSLEPVEADDLATFRVASPHKVHGVKRPGTLRLNPNDPLTQWLVKHGHLKPEKEG